MGVWDRDPVAGADYRYAVCEQENPGFAGGYRGDDAGGMAAEALCGRGGYHDHCRPLLAATRHSRAAPAIAGVGGGADAALAGARPLPVGIHDSHAGCYRVAIVGNGGGWCDWR